MEGTLSFMHKKVKFKGHSGFMVECIFCFLTRITLTIFIRMGKISKPFIQNKKHFRNRTKGFRSILDQRQDLFWDTRDMDVSIAKRLSTYIF